MEYYNPYMELYKQHIINPDKNYVSEIAFINAKPAVIFRNLYYVEFSKFGKTGFYLDNNDYLKKLSYLIRNNKRMGKPKPVGLNDDEIEYLNNTSGFIKSAHINTKYFAYVKILEDKQNPQLEGRIMIMKFGRRIKDTIQDYFTNGSSRNFDKTFKFIVSLSSGIPNYDECHFTDKDINIFDPTLNLNSESSSLPQKEKTLPRKTR